jgi:hypothetical protein
MDRCFMVRDAMMSSWLYYLVRNLHNEDLVAEKLGPFGYAILISRRGYLPVLFYWGEL